MDYFPKVTKPNMSYAWAFPAIPILFAFSGFSNKNNILFAQTAKSVGGRRKPADACTLSKGPPELHAKTGLYMYIASTGTIPKCSFYGV